MPARHANFRYPDITLVKVNDLWVASLGKKLRFWGRELTVGCPVVVSPLPREWSCLYRRGQSGISFLEIQIFFMPDLAWGLATGVQNNACADFAGQDQCTRRKLS